ncbi:MAG: exodeoxyribonuclease VII small subunit [Candidatus Omnitrophica bacterium]|nr:exodeoxyribonuclease VII small subunit [Candidatus Omnitrophota bacterium]
MAKKSPKGVNFEKALAELEDIVKKLEEGEICLAEAMKLYEEGVRRAKECFAVLNASRRKIEILQKEAEAFITRPFDEGAVSEE